jgi:S1-C subfamily serine protease
MLTWLTCLLLVDVNAHLPTEVRVVLATVRVTNVRGEAVGSGVLVGQRPPFAYVLTAAHVVDKADRPTVEAFNGPTVRRAETTEIVLRSKEIDFALLRVPANTMPRFYLALADHPQLVRTNRFAALTVGCSDGEPPTLLTDEVLRRRLVRRAVDAERLFWETQGVPVGGRSGGPLVDRAGRVIGICSGTQDGRGYYTHADEIHAALKRAGWGWLVRPPSALPAAQKILEK